VAGPGVLAPRCHGQGARESVLAATTSPKMPLGAVVRAMPADRAAAFAKARSPSFLSS
jgi:hypothetical protein